MNFPFPIKWRNGKERRKGRALWFFKLLLYLRYRKQSPVVLEEFKERMKSRDYPVRSRSLSLPHYVSHQIDDDAEDESVSEAGDTGDRALHSRKHSESNNSIRLSLESFDSTPENGVVVSIPRGHKLQPLTPQLKSPLSINGFLGSEDGEFYFTPCAPTKEEPHKELPKILDYASCLIHLAVFGILGVFTRYLLQKLFGPGVADVTSDQTILYPDLPSNMVGSFFMGWFGVVFKGDISNVSEHLAIAITTGYLGSLTTFSGWNQKMLDLSVSGHWLFSALGFLIGLFLVAFSIIFGIETAKGFKWLLRRLSKSSGSCIFKIKWKVDNYKRQLAVMLVLLGMLGSLWGVCGALEKAKFKHGGSAAQLWLACLLGPLGVWIRWFLARLNGCGLGRAGLFKWIPFGTLIANVSAASLMAVLARVNKSVNKRDWDTIVGGIQFGLMGCLSTVSTFATEFNAMRESKHPWRAYAYAMITLCASFSFGILIYCVPVWTKGFDK